MVYYGYMNKHVPHNKKHIIQLSDQERQQLKHITKRGTHQSRVIKRATILLKSDEGLIDKDIAAQTGVEKSTVERVRKRYAEEGLERALHDAPRPGKPPVLHDKAEARLVAIACSDPPEGIEHWTLELLQERLLADKIVDSISTVAIWHHLTERGIKPWREKNVVRSQD